MSDRETTNKQLQGIGHYMKENDLAWGNAGNISTRTSGDNFLITASGTSLGELNESDFIECNLKGKTIYASNKPSKEVPMHIAVYQKRPEINAVLHCSPFYSTIVACSNLEIPAKCFVESMYYLEKVARVPYQHPGSDGLGDAVRNKAKKANILLLENHGVLVYETSVKEALMALQTLEYTCKMLITAIQASIDLSQIPDKVVHDFLHHSGYKPRREWEEV